MDVIFWVLVFIAGCLGFFDFLDVIPSIAIFGGLVIWYLHAIVQKLNEGKKPQRRNPYDCI